MSDWLLEKGILLFLAIGIVALAIGLGIQFAKSDEHNKAAYDAWCKLNNRTDITLEEFTTLRRSYLLPGQDLQAAAEAQTTAAVAIGISAANAGR